MLVTVEGEQLIFHKRQNTNLTNLISKANFVTKIVPGCVFRCRNQDARFVILNYWKNFPFLGGQFIIMIKSPRFDIHLTANML